MWLNQTRTGILDVIKNVDWFRHYFKMKMRLITRDLLVKKDQLTATEIGALLSTFR